MGVLQRQPHRRANGAGVYPIEPRRCRKIDIFTGQRAAGAAGYKADAVRECECQLVDYLHAAEATAQGQGITSVSNDGYSESYQASTPELLEANLRAAAFAWLSGTGLMGAF